MTYNAKELALYILAQMAAESYLEGGAIVDLGLLQQRLRLGNNNHSQFNDPEAASREAALSGKTRMSDSQIRDFSARYEIVDHLPNTWSGFSGTLFRDRVTGEYALSFRSTEFANDNKGGDWSRDGLGGAGGEISNYGFAVAQIADAEAYFRRLKGEGKLPAGANYNVTGYSLGGHIATVFAEAHADDAKFLGAYTFNSPGRGELTNGTAKDFVNTAYDKLSVAGMLLVPGTDASGATRNLYSETPYMGTDQISGVLQDILSTNGYLPRGLSVLSSTPTNLANGKITQVFGHADFDDTEWVANTGVHSNNKVQLFIEDQPDIQGLFAGWLGNLLGIKSDFGTTHSITLLAESLAVSAILQTVDANISDQTVRSILSAASNERASGFLGSQGKAESDSLERVLEGLAKLFRIDLMALGIATPNGRIPRDDSGGGFGNLTNRNAFYNTLDALEQAIGTGGGYIVGALKDLTDVDVIELAGQNDSTGLAYRFALRELNPFVVIDTQNKGLYARYQAGGANAGELDLYDPASEQGRNGLTEFYLQDRAAFLERKLYITALNRNQFYADPATSATNSNSFPNAPDARGQAYQREAKDFQDRASGFIASDGSPNRNSQQHFIFGAAGPDVINGAGRDDHLYGGAGSDVITGGQDTDYLEGGKGFDTYRFRANDGLDTILDSDGKGVIIRNGSGLAIGVKQSDTQWSFGSTTFAKSTDGKDLEIAFAGSDDKVTVKDFDFASAQQGGSLAIRLIDAPTVAANLVRTFFGDKEDWDSDSNQEGIQPQSDGLGNSIRADGQGRPVIAEPDRADFFYGAENSEVERFTTAGGDDTVNADGISSATSSVGGRDFIEAGAGRDIVVAGVGDDWVEGGTQADILSGNAGDDAIFAQTTNGQTLTIAQAISAGETEARSTDAGELLTGDAGRDMLFGAATDDLLLGGEGEDLVIGGGGDDTVYGDLSVTTADRGWTIQRTVTVQGGTTRYAVTGQNVTFLTPGVGLGRADAIYAGAGMDWV
ncbi:MAG: calcium-binding protein, partial [Methyloceanibacter sp.]